MILTVFSVYKAVAHVLEDGTSRWFLIETNGTNIAASISIKIVFIDYIDNRRVFICNCLFFPVLSSCFSLFTGAVCSHKDIIIHNTHSLRYHSISIDIGKISIFHYKRVGSLQPGDRNRPLHSQFLQRRVFFICLLIFFVGIPASNRSPHCICKNR